MKAKAIVGRKLPCAAIMMLLFLSATGLIAQPRIEKNRVRLAQDFERMGNYEQALRIYDSLYRAVPKNQLYFEGVRRNMLRLKRYDDLIAILMKQIELSANPKHLADLGDVYYKRGDRARADSTWKQAIAQHAGKKTVYLYVASAMVNNRLYDDAMGLYLRARDALKQPDAFVFELANIYVLRLKYAQATREYLNYLEANPAQFSFIESRMASYTADPEQADEVASLLTRWLTESKHPHLIRKLLANLYLRSANYALAFEAFKSLEEDKQYRKSNNNLQGKEIYFFAERALHAGNYRYAEEGFRLIVEQYAQSPFHVRALYGLALSKQKQGLAQEALASYEALIERSRRSPWAEDAAFQIGEIYLHDLFDLSKALSAYQAFIRDFPTAKNRLEAHFRVGECYLALGDLDLARRWFQRVEPQARANRRISDRVKYKLAYLHFLAAEYEQSLALLKDITASMDGAAADQVFVNDALELAFFIEENVKSAEGALKLFSEAKKAQHQRNDTLAREKLASILDTYPDAEIADDVLLELAELENRRQNYLAAIGYLQRLLEKHPESIHNALAQKRVADIYADGLGDVASAAQAFERILIDYPESLYVEEARTRLRRLTSPTRKN